MRTIYYDRTHPHDIEKYMYFCWYKYCMSVLHYIILNTFKWVDILIMYLVVICCLLQFLFYFISIFYDLMCAC